MKILVTYPSREELHRIIGAHHPERRARFQSPCWIAMPFWKSDRFAEVLVAPHVREYAVPVGDGHAARTERGARMPGSIPLRQFAARRPRRGGMRARAGADARPLPPGHRGRAARRSAVLRHRIILNFDAHADGQTPETILDAIIQGVTARVSAS